MVLPTQRVQRLPQQMPSVAEVGYTVIGGYLGAGKTTLLNHLLRHANGRRLALLINDFGAINVDADLIESQTDQQINLTNGCVCCGLADGFDTALESLLSADAPPDHIVVEASGVADVAALAQYGHAAGLQLDGVIVHADAETVRTKAADKYVAKTVQRQLRAADLLVLNKIDLVDHAKRAAVLAWLEELVPDATVVPVTHGAVPTAILLAHEHRTAPKPLELAEPGEHGHHEQYATWSYVARASATRAQVERFVAALPPAVLRGKGWFETVSGALLWQRVGQRQTLSAQSEVPGNPAIVIIGLSAQMDSAELARLAAACFDAP